MSEYLHNHKEFASLINILADEKKIESGLIEKDYWIMHVLYGLKKQGFQFELKGGTSLSKGHKLMITIPKISIFILDHQKILASMKTPITVRKIMSKKEKISMVG